MWTIDKPAISAGDAYDTCIKGLRDSDQRNRLQSAKQTIIDAEANFDQKACRAELHLIQGATHVNGTAGNISTAEMTNLYDYHMARQKSRGRPLYEKIMIAAEHGICPFCGHLPVSTLDHVLPKTLHPALSLTPSNLIPSCKDCNHNKGTATPATQESQFLHAYYDDINNDRWLYAQIIETSPAGATFHVKPPAEWDAVTAARVQNQFTRLKLAALYASQAGRQLQNIRYALKNIFDAGGSDAVRQDLERMFNSLRMIRANSWEVALYEAAAANDWYCNGGFDS